MSRKYALSERITKSQAKIKVTPSNKAMSVSMGSPDWEIAIVSVRESTMGSR